MKCPRLFQGAEEKWGDVNIIQKVGNPLWIIELQSLKLSIHTQNRSVVVPFSNTTVLICKHINIE